jgi:hypothetical protein
MSTGLLELQRRMAAAVMQPLTADDFSRKRRADGSVMAEDAAEFIKPSHILSSFERLEIYNRQYWFRLYDAFTEDFPGLQAVLGRKQFELLMRAYLQDCPSTSYTLRDLGSKLNAWLPRHAQMTAPRTLLAEDVARLEWAHVEAYDAALLPPPSQDFLSSLHDDSRLQLQPSVRLLALSYPVDDMLVAVRQSAGSSDISSNNATTERRSPVVRRVSNLAPGNIWLAVHRQEFTVYYKRLDPAEFRMLSTIQAGATLAEVFASAATDETQIDEQHAGFLQQCFYNWSVLGWLTEPQANPL